MCVSTSPSAPVAQTSYRDTSNDPIKSNYALTDAQKAENARRKAKNKAKSLVQFGDDDNPPPPAAPKRERFGTGTGALGMDIG